MDFNASVRIVPHSRDAGKLEKRFVNWFKKLNTYQAEDTKSSMALPELYIVFKGELIGRNGKFPEFYVNLKFYAFSD